MVKETVTEAEVAPNSNGTTVAEYIYDCNSNRLTRTVDDKVTEYTYNELNHLILETNIFYEYDLNGNLVKNRERAGHDPHLSVIVFSKCNGKDD